MTVGFERGFEPEWFRLGWAFVVLISSIFSTLFMMILIVKKKHQDLLFRMLPKKVIGKLQRGQNVTCRYNLATIFFADIVGFSTLSGNMNAMDMMTMLNHLHGEFDKLVGKHNIYKVETTSIGDEYVVIGGGPDYNSVADGAEHVALFALDVMEFVQNYKTITGDSVYLRAGIASGPVVAGVIGSILPKFTLFGDTVNFASRMQSTGKDMRIQCSEMTYKILKDAPSKSFKLEQRIDGDKSTIYVKGKGRVCTWWLNAATERERQSILQRQFFEELNAIYDEDNSDNSSDDKQNSS